MAIAVFKPFHGPNGAIDPSNATFNAICLLLFAYLLRIIWCIARGCYLVIGRQCCRGVLEELLETDAEKRTERLLDLCFWYIGEEKFDTDELFDHIGRKLATKEKNQGQNDKVLEGLKKREVAAQREEEHPTRERFYQQFLLRDPFESLAYGPSLSEFQALMEERREEKAGKSLPLARGSNGPS